MFKLQYSIAIENVLDKYDDLAVIEKLKDGRWGLRPTITEKLGKRCQELRDSEDFFQR